MHHTNRRGQRLGTLAGPVGGFAEYTTVSQLVATRIPKEMPLDRAALLACGVSTGFGAVINRARVRAMDSVVVIGTGGVGVNSIQAARYAGASPVIAVDILESKLATAIKFGATRTINLKEEKDPVKKVFELTAGRGADFAFVTVGNVEAVRQGFSMCGPRGMTVVIGLMINIYSCFFFGHLFVRRAFSLILLIDRFQTDASELYPRFVIQPD